MYEKLDKCPICENEKISNFLICKDHVVSGESFALTKCENCGFLFTNPRPSKEIIHTYYQSEKYLPHHSDYSLFSLSYGLIRFFNNKWKINLLNENSEKGNILDVGCGRGDFLKNCQENAWQISGVEPDPDSNKLASENLSIEIFDNLDKIPEGNLFQAITFWHVLEHIHDLHETIESIKKHISKNGKIFIALPNNLSRDAEIYKEFWAAYDVPRHLYHFNKDSFSRLMKLHGLKIQEIIPMPMDTYYVSLLSEKYATGKYHISKSVISAYKSNSYAEKNNNAHSSLLFVVKK